MQEQNKLTACIPIPLELMEEAGIGPLDGIQMCVEDGCIIIERLEESQCCDLPDPAELRDDELYQFLTGLTSSQKHKAMVYLTLLWAENHIEQITDEDQT